MPIRWLASLVAAGALYGCGTDARTRGAHETPRAPARERPDVDGPRVATAALSPEQRRVRAIRALRPRVVQSRIPYGPDRRRDMAAYARRHYGLDTSAVRREVVVLHFTANDSVEATVNTFAPNVADPELRELPGTCAHFVIARDGTIHQLVALDRMCRHAVGLNHVSIGVEHVGRSDAQVLGNRRQLSASLRLTRWLRCRDQIALKDVIGHNENTASSWHRERVARLRRQTHGDFAAAASRRYRRLLARRGCP